MKLDCAGKIVDLSVPRIMGILNVTPDSFFDGGRYAAIDAAVRRAERMVDEGADIIDIGGESTRPGAQPVSESEEMDRVLPVIERLAGLPVPVSVDTSKPAVMCAAALAGAGMINDVCALREPGALEAAAGLRLPVCLMHMQGRPRTMQQAPRYDDVLDEVAGFLQQRVQACEQAGIARGRLLIDPGFGFGKSLQHNLQLLARLAELRELRLPVLVGLSRKSMFGVMLDSVTPRTDVDRLDRRLYCSLGAAVQAAMQGAAIIRVHDVGETYDALLPLRHSLTGNI